jgi:hypothetical protein
VRRGVTSPTTRAALGGARAGRRAPFAHPVKQDDIAIARRKLQAGFIALALMLGLSQLGLVLY